MIEKLEVKGELEVVKSEMLNAFSLDGWELVAILDETGVSYVSEEAPWHSAGVCSSTMQVKKAIPFSQASYLMRRNEESTIARLSKKIRDLEESLRETEKEAKLLDKSLDRAVGEQGRLEKVENELIRTRDTERQKFHELRDSYQKMEDDLAKVRKALGTRKMEEILATED